MIIYSLASGGVSLADPRMIFSKNRDTIYLEKNSATIFCLCRLCSEAFLMFRGAKIIKNTMLLFVERIGSTLSPSANTALTASFLPSLWVFLLFVWPAEDLPLFAKRGKGKRSRAKSKGQRQNLVFFLKSFPMSSVYYTVHVFENSNVFILTCTFTSNRISWQDVRKLQ